MTTDPSEDLHWTPSALAMLKKIPFFVRPQATGRIQHLARTAGVEVVTTELVEQARVEFGQ